MSIVIATKVDNKVVMMADSAETLGEKVTTLTEPERMKVLVIGDVLVGSAGRVKNIRRLAEHPEWFDTKQKEFNKEFIVTKIIPKLFQELEKHEFLDTDDDFPKNEASVIMSCGNRIFYMQPDFSVHEINKFVAVGCTKRLIHSTLSNIQNGKENEAMLAAMRLSSELSPGVRPPYYVIDTERKEYKKIEE